MRSIKEFRVGESEIFDISSITKSIRSEIIADDIRKKNLDGAVCFSSGTALHYLREAVPYVLGVSDENGDLRARRWFPMKEIKRIFPTLYDATSGHLTRETIIRCSERLKREVKCELTTALIASGSGESALIANYAFPECNFIPIFDQRNQHTKWSAECELNDWLREVFAFGVLVLENGITIKFEFK